MQLQLVVFLLRCSLLCQPRRLEMIVFTSGFFSGNFQEVTGSLLLVKSALIHRGVPEICIFCINALLSLHQDHYDHVILPQVSYGGFSLLFKKKIFSSTFSVMFPLSEVVLMIPRCVTLSTDVILLGPNVKVELLDSCLHCLWEMFRTTLFVGCNS